MSIKLVHIICTVYNIRHVYCPRLLMCTKGNEAVFFTGSTFSGPIWVELWYSGTWLRDSRMKLQKCPPTKKKETSRHNPLPEPEALQVKWWPRSKRIKSAEKAHIVLDISLISFVFLSRLWAVQQRCLFTIGNRFLFVFIGSIHQVGRPSTTSFYNDIACCVRVCV